MLIRFIKSHGSYNGGEVAGFSPDEAARLCDKLGVATRVEEPAAKPGKALLPLDPKEAEALATFRERQAKNETLSKKDQKAFDELVERETVKPTESTE